MVLYEAPARLNRAEVGRVGWKKQQAGADTLDELADSGSVVGSEVVEHDDIAWVQPWTEGLTHELDEPRPVHGTGEDLMAKYAITAHGADDREVAAPVAGLVIDHPFAAQGASVREAHCEIASGLIDYDQPIERDFSEFLTERGPLFLDLLALLLTCTKAFFSR